MSRLLASTLMRSSKASGNLREMVVVDGFKLGSTACFALLQSTKSVESCVSQKARSSASVLKVGILDLTVLIDISLFSVHIPGGDNPNQCALGA